ncbi:MAG: Lipopolysaccharide O-side chain biosynthesis protein (O-antigen transporter) [Parcubacteria group bacterium Gr01-1014_19]|nr:MAG: Lipopolysaccharide O-side chain biosynthesis protein (O-antigen transporter) [Parcubacteria group bacterium Gr01-1014_19]
MFKFLFNFLLKNRTVGQTIAKNTFWLFFGQITGRLFRAAIVIYAARVLGAASWGAFSYALGLAAFLTIFSDIGINALITKETSRNPELRNKYIATAFWTKLVLLGLLIAGVAVALPYLTNIPEAAIIMPILMFVFAFDTLRDLGSAISRAMEKMEIESLIGVFTNLAIVVLGFIFLTFTPTSQSLAYAYAIGSGLGLLAIWFVLREYFGNIFSNFDKKLVKDILATAWPFGLMGLMGAINLNTDIIMVGWMRSAAEVGFYSAAQKPVLLLYIIPTLLASSIFPVMARMAKTFPGAVAALLEKAIAGVILCAIPVVILGVIFAGPIINILFGPEYFPAINTFRILIFTVLIVYPSAIIGNAIFAFDAQKSFVWFVMVSAVGNILLNFLLIPIWGIEGAAISTLITQLITNFLIWRKMNSIHRLHIWPQFGFYLRFLTRLVR